jgi:hypothetical protein
MCTTEAQRPQRTPLQFPLRWRNCKGKDTKPTKVTKNRNKVCAIELDWCAVEPKQFFVTFVGFVVKRPAMLAWTSESSVASVPLW